MKRLAGAFVLVPGPAFSCALPPSVILLLPTGHYILGAAMTVAMTALLGAFSQRLPVMSSRMVYSGPNRFPFVLTSYLSFLAFLGLLMIGFYGATDPLHNLLTLGIWTGVWVALPLACMLGGNLWAGVNPWVAPVRMVRSLIGRTGNSGLARLGHWPAVVGLLAFSWFQIIAMTPDDPTVLAQAALIYWLVIFVAAVAEGEDWLEQAEFLTVLMGMVARIAPFWRVRTAGQVQGFIGWPGAQVITMKPLELSEMAFVTLVLAALSFDGLSGTFFWLGMIGENPLEFTGRSAVQGVNTAGLLGVWAVTAAAIWTVFWLGRWIDSTFSGTRVVLSFLAIAAGYHAAHYLVTLLTAGQFTIAALNDPLYQGDDFLGLPPFYVSYGFLGDGAVMTLIYAVQFAVILGAHLLAVILALRLAGKGRALAHLPLTGLMVGYTVLGLWLLSTARGA